MNWLTPPPRQPSDEYMPDYKKLAEQVVDHAIGQVANLIEGYIKNPRSDQWQEYDVPDEVREWLITEVQMPLAYLQRDLELRREGS